MHIQNPSSPIMTEHSHKELAIISIHLFHKTVIYMSTIYVDYD